MKHVLKGIVTIFTLLALIACQDVTSGSTPNLMNRGATANIVAGFEGDVTIKAMANGNYISHGGGDQLYASAAAKGSSEVFTLESLGGDNYAIKSKVNGKYLCADLNLNGEVVANRDVVQGWETFTLIALGGDNYALQAHSNGRYLCADLEIGGKLAANRDAIQGWETFTIIKENSGPGKLTVAYSDQVDWGNGYNGRLVITNGTNEAVSDWKVTFNAPTIDAMYGCNWSQSGSLVTVTPSTGAGPIPANGGTYPEIIFTVYNSSERPSNIQINGGTPVIPDPPTSVRGLEGNEKATITWNDSYGATSYNVYRSDVSGSGKSGIQFSNVTSPFVQTGLTNGEDYYYVVTAVNDLGESEISSEVKVTPEYIVVFAWNNPSIGPWIHGQQANGNITEQKSAEWDSIIPPMAGMKIVNNLWGIGDDFQNGTGSGTIFSETVGDTYAFGWSWDFTPTRPQIEVIAYQEVGWGWSPNSSDWFNGEVPLHRINENKTYTIDFDLKRTNREGAWNTAFDIWLSPEEHPVGGTGTFGGIYEIMIWFDYEQQGPWGSNPQPVTINGSDWLVYDNDGAAGWRVISYLYQGDKINNPINHVRGYNISNFINDAASRYSSGTAHSIGLSTSHYINAIEFGSEACGGKGMMELANYGIYID